MFRIIGCEDSNEIIKNWVFPSRNDSMKKVLIKGDFRLGALGKNIGTLDFTRQIFRPKVPGTASREKRSLSENHSVREGKITKFYHSNKNNLVRIFENSVRVDRIFFILNVFSKIFRILGLGSSRLTIK